MASVPAGVLPPEVANDPRVVCRKAGLTEFHARLLIALERIASYYDTLPPVTHSKKGARDDA